MNIVYLISDRLFLSCNASLIASFGKRTVSIWHKRGEFTNFFCQVQIFLLAYLMCQNDTDSYILDGFTQTQTDDVRLVVEKFSA